jgi:recombinational DNA repair protein RecR
MKLADYEKEVQDEVAYILVKLLEYPSSQVAEGHRKANRLGLYDLKSYEEARTELELAEENRTFCKDCGLVVQPSSIPVCTDFS